MSPFSPSFHINPMPPCPLPCLALPPTHLNKAGFKLLLHYACPLQQNQTTFYTIRCAPNAPRIVRDYVMGLILMIGAAVQFV